jgi:phosphatidylserine/phosphatidylglycerophosphate/cardiolipin synthase-like enzyme
MYNKRGIITLIVLLIFSAGVITGCNNKDKIITAASKVTDHAKAVVPTAFTGIHTFQSVGTTEVAFSPEGGITNMVVKEIGSAKKSIQVQAYSFTSKEIIQALINAKKHGVDVRIIIDKSNINGEDTSRGQKEKELLDSIVNGGIPMKVDSDFQIAHSKIMIIDGIDIITGSFNFTYSAEHNNAENCLILHGNKQLADQYVQNWQWRWEATSPYSK